MTRPDPLAALVAEPGRAAVLTDFDGTLAEIVDDPAAARPVDGAVEALARLVGSVARVGVVSGRPVAFLRRVLPVDGLELFGVYGMERWLDGGVVVDHRVEPFVAAVEGAAAAAEREIPGLLVERKGRVSCVLHWRTAPERAAEAIEVGRALATRFGLEASAGRKVLELRPPVPIDKGVAVAGLAEGMSAAMFAGDDVGDLAAFDALDRLVDAGGLGVAVTVAVASPEAPPDLLSRADEAVSGPPELVGLLATLADSIST